MRCYAATPAGAARCAADRWLWPRRCSGTGWAGAGGGRQAASAAWGESLARRGAGAGPQLQQQPRRRKSLPETSAGCCTSFGMRPQSATPCPSTTSAPTAAPAGGCPVGSLRWLRGPSICLPPSQGQATVCCMVTCDGPARLGAEGAPVGPSLQRPYGPVLRPAHQLAILLLRPLACAPTRCVCCAPRSVHPGKWLGPWVMCRALEAAAAHAQQALGVRVAVIAEPGGGAPMLSIAR